MNKSFVCILMLLLLSTALSAKDIVEKFNFKQEMIEISFTNVKVEEVNFVSGNTLEIRSNDKDVIFNQDKQYLGISATDKKARIKMKLPASKKYHVVKDDRNIYFDQDGMNMISNDSKKIFADGKILKITDQGDEVIVYENGDITVNDDNGDVVVINEEGITVLQDGMGKDDKEITNFWGKMLAAVIRVTARTAMNAIGENPEEVAKTLLNETNWKVDIDEMMNKVEENASSFNRKDHSREVKRNFSAAEISSLSLDNFNGNIIVESTDGDELEADITIYADTEDNLDNVEIEFTGTKHLKIRSKALKVQHHCGIVYEIKLPESITLDKVSSSNGKININGCQGEAELVTSNGSIDVDNYTGDLELRTSNGSIDIENVDGSINVHTSNGSIEAKEVSGRVYARSSNGKIEIEDCSDIRVVETSNGKIVLDLENVIEDLDVSTCNADVSIILSRKINCNIQARTSNGKIKLQDIKLDILSSTRNYLSAAYNGGGKLLDLETSNASINIYNQ